LLGINSRISSEYDCSLVLYLCYTKLWPFSLTTNLIFMTILYSLNFFPRLLGSCKLQHMFNQHWCNFSNNNFSEAPLTRMIENGFEAFGMDGSMSCFHPLRKTTLSARKMCAHWITLIAWRLLLSRGFFSFSHLLLQQHTQITFKTNQIWSN